MNQVAYRGLIRQTPENDRFVATDDSIPVVASNAWLKEVRA
jgi:hypothetical protein